MTKMKFSILAIKYNKKSQPKIYNVTKQETSTINGSVEIVNVLAKEGEQSAYQIETKVFD